MTVVMADVAEQPAPLVRMTKKLPLVVTEMLCVVAPVFQLHWALAPPEAVSVTLPPAQKRVGPPAEMLAVGAALIVTDVVADAAAQPPAAPMALVTV